MLCCYRKLQKLNYNMDQKTQRLVTIFILTLRCWLKIRSDQMLTYMLGLQVLPEAWYRIFTTLVCYIYSNYSKSNANRRESFNGQSPLCSVSSLHKDIRENSVQMSAAVPECKTKYCFVLNKEKFKLKVVWKWRLFGYFHLVLPRRFILEYFFILLWIIALFYVSRYFCCVP